MSDTTQLATANAGDTLDTADMQASIDTLLALADSLNEPKAKAATVQEVQELGRTQQELGAMAQALVNKQIALLAGEAKITAAHIDAASRAASDAIAKIAGVKKKLQTIGKVLDFFAVVLRGSGTKILEAAIGLKGALVGA